MHAMTRVLLASILTASIAGCNTSPTSSRGGEQATFSKISGSISTSVAASLDRTFDAAKSAMGDMQYTTDRATKDALKGIIEAREADGRKVTTTVTRRADDITDISISVGTMGDEAKARMILDKILARVH